MAIRMQTGRSRPFFVYWTNPFTGKRESKSCGTEEEAKKLDAYIKYQLRYERGTFRREMPVEKKRPIVQTLESVMYLYLKDRQLSKTNLKFTLMHAASFLDTYGDTPIEKINKKVLQEIQDRYVAAQLKSGTIRRRMGIVKAVMRWAHRKELIENLPLFPTLPTVKYARYVPPTPEEIETLFRASPDHLQRVIILGYYVGMRVGNCELLRLKWHDVDFSARIIRVPNADKGNQSLWREVPISEDITCLLKKWYDADIHQGTTDTVIHFNGHPVSSIRTAWLHALRRSGITRHIRPYDLRHGFATQLIANGADVGTVAQLMGHNSPTMVLTHYQHVMNSQKRMAISALPPVPKCVQTHVCKRQ